LPVINYYGLPEKSSHYQQKKESVKVKQKFTPSHDNKARDAPPLPLPVSEKYNFIHSLKHQQKQKQQQNHPIVERFTALKDY